MINVLTLSTATGYFSERFVDQSAQTAYTYVGWSKDIPL